MENAYIVCMCGKAPCGSCVGACWLLRSWQWKYHQKPLLSTLYLCNPTSVENADERIFYATMLGNLQGFLRKARAVNNVKWVICSLLLFDLSQSVGALRYSWATANGIVWKRKEPTHTLSFWCWLHIPSIKFKVAAYCDDGYYIGIIVPVIHSTKSVSVLLIGMTGKLLMRDIIERTR